MVRCGALCVLSLDACGRAPATDAFSEIATSGGVRGDPGRGVRARRSALAEVSDIGVELFGGERAPLVLHALQGTQSLNGGRGRSGCIHGPTPSPDVATLALPHLWGCAPHPASQLARSRGEKVGQKWGGSWGPRQGPLALRAAPRGAGGPGADLLVGCIHKVTGVDAGQCARGGPTRTRQPISYGS